MSWHEFNQHARQRPDFRGPPALQPANTSRRVMLSSQLEEQLRQLNRVQSRTPVKAPASMVRRLIGGALRINPYIRALSLAYDFYEIVNAEYQLAPQAASAPGYDFTGWTVEDYCGPPFAFLNNWSGGFGPNCGTYYNVAAVDWDAGSQGVTLIGGGTVTRARMYRQDTEIAPGVIQTVYAGSYVKTNATPGVPESPVVPGAPGAMRMVHPNRSYLPQIMPDAFKPLQFLPEAKPIPYRFLPYRKIDPNLPDGQRYEYGPMPHPSEKPSEVSAAVTVVTPNSVRVAQAHHVLRPPRSREKERKARLPFFTGRALLDATTEAVDVINVFYSALEQPGTTNAQKFQYYARFPSGQIWFNPPPHVKLMAIYANYDKLDIEAVIWGLAQNEIEDYLIGNLARGAATATPFHSPLWGPAL